MSQAGTLLNCSTAGRKGITIGCPALAAYLVLRPVAAICAVWLPAALAVKAVGRLIPARAEIVPVVTMGSANSKPL